MISQGRQLKHELQILAIWLANCKIGNDVKWQNFQNIAYCKMTQHKVTRYKMTGNKNQIKTTCNALSETTFLQDTSIRKRISTESHLKYYLHSHQCPKFRVSVISCVTLQNFITKIAPDHFSTLSSFTSLEGLDSARAAGTF